METNSVKNILTTAFILFGISTVQAAEAITPLENAVCRKDAIRNCFFGLGSAETTRACSRKNMEALSPKCKALILKKLTGSPR
jgi:hypothetical protein